jgi:hypothetical protein
LGEDAAGTLDHRQQLRHNPLPVLSGHIGRVDALEPDDSGEDIIGYPPLSEATEQRREADVLGDEGRVEQEVRDRLALPRGDKRVVEGVDEDLAILLQPVRFSEGGPDVRHQHDLGPLVPGGLQVIARRGRRHDDRGRGPELPGGIGHPLPVVAAADGHHAALSLGRGQGQARVGEGEDVTGRQGRPPPARRRGG